MSDPITREYREAMPLHLLDAPQLDARLERDEEYLDELGSDIVKRGMIFPIAVVRVGERYEVIDGECRHLAAKRKGLVVVPVFIYPTKEAALEGIKFAANNFRRDMSPAEEALFFHELMKHECAGDIEQVCALVNKKFSYVSGRLELLAGDERVFDAVRQRKISLGVAAELNKITDPQYVLYYLDNAIRTGATVSLVTAWAQEWRQLFGDQPRQPARPEHGDAAPPTMVVDPFACIVCGKSDHSYAIRHQPIHTHCQVAILEPLLNAGRGSDG